MAESSPEAPRERVEIIKVDKRGESYVVEGIVEGKKVSVEIGAQHERTRTRKEFEALMKRSLYGTKKMDDEAR